MYQLDEIKFFYFLLIIPVIIMVFVYNKYWKNRVIKNNFSMASLNYLVPEFSKTKDSLKLIIQLFAIIFLIIGVIFMHITLGTGNFELLWAVNERGFTSSSYNLMFGTCFIAGSYTHLTLPPHACVERAGVGV